jgi:hypothetical protein
MNGFARPRERFDERRLRMPMTHFGTRADGFGMQQRDRPTGPDTMR